MKNQTRSKKRGRLEEDNTQDSDSEVCEFGSWSTWQLIDPLLPTGGFAHSGGLEAAANCGVCFFRFRRGLFCDVRKDASEKRWGGTSERGNSGGPWSCGVSVRFAERARVCACTARLRGGH